MLFFLCWVTSSKLKLRLLTSLSKTSLYIWFWNFFEVWSVVFAVFVLLGFKNKKKTVRSFLLGSKTSNFRAVGRSISCPSAWPHINPRKKGLTILELYDILFILTICDATLLKINLGVQLRKMTIRRKLTSVQKNSTNSNAWNGKIYVYKSWGPTTLGTTWI